MKWLSQIGQIALQLGKIAPIAGPILSALIPGTKDAAIIAKATTTIDQLAGIIVQAEIMGQALNLKGPDKLKAATPAIAQMILQSSVMTGRTIADPVLFEASCTGIASHVAGLLNSLKADA